MTVPASPEVDLYARALAARAGPTTIRLVPQIVNLELYAGDGVEVMLTVTDPDEVPVPLTGVVDAHIRRARPDPDPPLADWTVDLTDGPQGVVHLSLTGAETAALMEQAVGGLILRFHGYWDVQWTAAGQQPLTLCQGDVYCHLDVTRP